MPLSLYGQANQEMLKEFKKKSINRLMIYFSMLQFIKIEENRAILMKNQSANIINHVTHYIYKNDRNKLRKIFIEVLCSKHLLTYKAVTPGSETSSTILPCSLPLLRRSNPSGCPRTRNRRVSMTALKAKSRTHSKNSQYIQVLLQHKTIF